MWKSCTQSFGSWEMSSTEKLKTTGYHGWRIRNKWAYFPTYHLSLGLVLGYISCYQHNTLECPVLIRWAVLFRNHRTKHPGAIKHSTRFLSLLMIWSGIQQNRLLITLQFAFQCRHLSLLKLSFFRRPGNTTVKLMSSLLQSGSVWNLVLRYWF